MLTIDNFQEIIFWIDDPATFQSFCMTCKLLYSLSITFVEIKKQQFSTPVVDRNGSIRIEYLMLPNRWVHGIHKSFSNDSLLIETTFVNGKIQGIQKEWYQENGPLYKETQYVDNCKQGACKTYYVSGNLWNHYSYTNNYIHGVATWYNDDAIGSFKHKRHGNLWYYCTYDYGVKQGLCERYYNNGSIFKQESYVNNKKHGICRVWDESGNESMIKEYNNGILCYCKQIYKVK